MKLGSLFDGSGGFPLAGALCGIEPVWASEVEPYPIAVTSTRFPHMKHLGDISQINGAEIEPVDIITFGSPCQDLSVAGKRAGLKHEDNGDDETTRSGLFIEAVRIIKEMREKTNGKYPRFAVWENVPGAFSSNKGEDFRIVLEELVKIIEPTAVMPEVPRFGWPYADSYCGDGWSLAYRVFDAQYWGVPQRRRRIYLVADFGGQCAREILFEREGLRGYFAESGKARKEITADSERSVGADDREGEVPYTLKIRSGVSVDSYGKSAGKGALIQKNLSATLGVSQDQYLFQPTCYGISAYESNSMKSSNPHSGVYEADTSRTLDLNGGNPACNQGGIAVVEPIAVATQQGGAEITENGVCPTITAAAGMSGNNQPWICQGLDAYNQALTGDKAKTINSAASDADHVPCVVVDSIGGQAEYATESDVSPCLKATHYKMPPCIVESAGFCTEHSAKSRSIGYEKEVSPTLRAGVTPACVYSVENHPNDSRVKIDESGKVQALTGRMGTGGGNVPMVMEPFCKSHRAQTADDATTWKHGKVANTLNTFDQGETRANELVVETVALEGNGQRPSHRGDGYAVTDKSYTLNSTEVHGVAYAIDQQGGKGGANYAENVMPTLCSDSHGTPHAVAYAQNEPVCVADHPTPKVDEKGCSFTLNARDYKAPLCTAYQDKVGSLCMSDYKGVGNQYISDNKAIVEKLNSVRYIVRRLTPTECARLQGFADRWGDIDPKSDFSDEEYRFWHDVRNTHAAINGKATKEYTKAQMLTWYNKLHTDSAEYKLWGNGIALPTALYVIQGIADVYEKQRQ